MKILKFALPVLLSIAELASLQTAAFSRDPKPDGYMPLNNT